MKPRSIYTPPVSRIRLTQILVPLDFSKESEPTLEHAAALAEAFSAGLHLLSVIEPYPFMSGAEEMPSLYLSDAEAAKITEGELKELAQRAIPPDLTATLSVRRGKPAQVISSTARKLAIHLIVMSSHGRSGLKRLLLGSTAEQVVRHAPCPVLVLRRRVLRRLGRQNSGLSGGLKEILVPVDFSVSSRRALRYASSFANRVGARLTVLSVVPPLTGAPYLVGGGIDYAKDEALRKAREELARLAKQELQPAAKTRVEFGVPFDQITRAAKELRSDLIIIGTQGRTGLRRAVLGSTAENVVRHAPCPVLVVRNQEIEARSGRKSRGVLPARVRGKALSLRNGAACV
jgi:nucleotide-binding universal stress UspA family protein